MKGLITADIHSKKNLKLIQELDLIRFMVKTICKLRR